MKRGRRPHPPPAEAHGPALIHQVMSGAPQDSLLHVREVGKKMACINISCTLTLHCVPIIPVAPSATPPGISMRSCTPSRTTDTVSHSNRCSHDPEESCLIRLVIGGVSLSTMGAMFRARSSNRSSREKIPWDKQWGGGGKVTCERPTASVGYIPLHSTGVMCSFGECRSSVVRRPTILLPWRGEIWRDEKEKRKK